jgi:magnesium transporter
MLINCAAYQVGRKLGDIEVEAVSDYLARPECFVWIALKDPDAAEMAEMKEEFGLHALAIEDVMNGNQRPKIEEYGDTLFAVLHTIEIGEDGELVMGQVNVFAGPNFVLSVRHRAQQGFQDVRARCEREPELLKEGAGFVLYALIDSVVDRYMPVLEVLSGEIEELEDRIFEKQDLGGQRAIIQDLYSLKRRLVILQHHVSPLVEAVGKLVGGRIPQICTGMQAYYRDVYDHLARGGRGNQAPRLVRRALCRADDDRGYLRDELPGDSRATLPLRLSALPGRHGDRGRDPVLPVPPRPVALSGRGTVPARVRRSKGCR